MKKTILFILLMASCFVFVEQLDAQNTNNVAIRKVDGGTMISFHMCCVDSGTAFTSPGFTAYQALRYIMKGNLASYTARDTTIANYIHSNDIYVLTRVKSKNSIDSLSSLYLKGAMSDGNFHTVDTLRTNGSTPIMTTVSWFGVPYYWYWEFVGTVADITASGYGVEVWVDIFIPDP